MILIPMPIDLISIGFVSNAIGFIPIGNACGAPVCTIGLSHNFGSFLRRLVTT
jgi:hypothetical protein